METDYDFLFKILIIGDSAVGKTSVLLRYIDDLFHPEFQTTIGVDFKVSTLSVAGTVVKLQLWDTAGQDRYRSIVSSCYRGAHGVIIMYDVTNAGSFEGVSKWHEESQKYLSSTVPRLLVANKIDLQGQRVVSGEQGRAWAERYKVQYIETSAKDNLHLEDAILGLATEILKRSGGTPVARDTGMKVGESRALRQGWCCA